MQLKLLLSSFVISCGIISFEKFTTANFKPTKTAENVSYDSTITFREVAGCPFFYFTFMRNNSAVF